MLIGLIDKFLRETGMPRTKFGRLAARDPRLVEDLRNGRETRPATTRAIEQFIVGYREGYVAASRRCRGETDHAR